ncbi:hypothetical protein [Allorhizocola rhizosphaerae]|nr:hypothetical protein [Allorhizocola rhizosphaerae]
MGKRFSHQLELPQLEKAVREACRVMNEHIKARNAADDTGTSKNK